MENEKVIFFQNELKKLGFDICAPFKVKSYNALSTKYPLKELDVKGNGPIGIVVGTTNYFFTKFTEFLKKEENKNADKNCIQLFVLDAVQKLFQNEILSKLNYYIRYDWDVPKTGNYVHVQTAGHVAGVAFYDQQSMWSVHPKYGVWFVFRFVIVFNEEYIGPEPEIPKPVLTEEEKKRLLHYLKLRLKKIGRI